MTAEVFLLSAHGSAATVEYAVAAERAGLGGVWLAEHHFISYGQCPSATVLAAHILAVTRSIPVGTAVCVLSNRHPVALGEEAALLESLAPGRFRLGVGRGGPWVDLEVFGTGLDRYRTGFTESLDVLRAWLSGARRVSADGPSFQFREVDVVPCTSVPVWVAAVSGSTVDMAAVRGLPLLLGVHDDVAAKKAMLDRYASVAAASGHDPARVPHASVHLVDPTRRPLRAWLERTTEYVRIDGSPSRDLDSYVDHLLRTHRLTVDEVSAALGVPHVLVMVEAAGDRTAVLDLIDALVVLIVSSSGVVAGRLGR